MIRIDLGKEEIPQPEEPKKPPLGLKLPEGWKLPDFKFDVVTGVTLLIAMAFAGLPYLFVDQYKTFFTSQKKAALKGLKEAEESYRQQISKFTTIQTELQNYEEQKKLINQRISTVRELLSNRGTPVNILDAIAQSLPQRAWINSIALEVGANPSVQLTGQSYTNENITDFSEKLAESIYLSDVLLEEVSASKRADIDVKSFRIKATPKGLVPIGAQRAVTSQPGTPPAAK